MWYPYFLYLSSKVERVQNRVVRFVTHSYNFRPSMIHLKKNISARLEAAGYAEEISQDKAF